ncbi:MAG: PKD domain-containing protein, partial [Dehalococcoidia bacterium]
IYIEPIVGISEGDSLDTSGYFIDSDPDTWNATVDYGDGSGVQVLDLDEKSFVLNHVYVDDGTYTITVNVSDGSISLGIGNILLPVSNVPPMVTINQPPKFSIPLLILINRTLQFSADFTDPGKVDTHTAIWDWGDGNVLPGTVDESNGSGTVRDFYSYSTIDNYTITLMVTDDDGGTGYDSHMVQVCDLSGAAQAVIDAIENLPNETFKRDAEKLKANLTRFLEQADKLTEKGNYKGASSVWEHTIRHTMDGYVGGKSDKDDWIIDPDFQLWAKWAIDEIVLSLNLMPK